MPIEAGATEQSRQGGPGAESRMDGGPERHDADAGLAIRVVVERPTRGFRHRHPFVGARRVTVVVARCGLEPEARRGRQGQDGDTGEDQGEDHQGGFGMAEQPARQREDAVAEDAAEATRQGHRSVVGNDEASAVAPQPPTARRMRRRRA